jgi:hypothetical protein
MFITHLAYIRYDKRKNNAILIECIYSIHYMTNKKRNCLIGEIFYSA